MTEKMMCEEIDAVSTDDIADDEERVRTRNFRRTIAKQASTTIDGMYEVLAQLGSPVPSKKS